jgi:hypothetical protein
MKWFLAACVVVLSIASVTSADAKAVSKGPLSVAWRATWPTMESWARQRAV